MNYYLNFCYCSWYQSKSAVSFLSLLKINISFLLVNNHLTLEGHFFPFKACQYIIYLNDFEAEKRMLSLLYPMLIAMAIYF